MKSFSHYFTLGLGVLAAGSLAVSATVQVRLSDGINTVVIADQDVEDLDPTIGVVLYQGPVGPAWVITLSTATSKPVIGSSAAPQMDLTGLNISAGVGTLSIEMTDTDFTGVGPFVASIGGTTEGFVSFATWTDAGNAPFGKTTPLTSQGPFPAISYGENATNVIAGTGPYSLTLQVNVTHTGPGLSGFDAFLYVEPEPPVEGHTGCRTTGGGRQADSFPKVAYVTHGGQVGAPVGNETAFDPDTKCIRGNWQHVRHMRGGNKGNFHAKSYDSLLCACLGCPEDPNAPVTIGDICNPDMRTCGPEPRQAPANKITFSGVGDYTEDKGKRGYRVVLFRVDLEDRGEPGNSHAKGSKPPHDRHRIRIWILTDAELAQLNNPADRLLGFRQAIAAGNGALLLKDGAILPNGNPVPNGTAVFGVRAPDIDDGGDMTHGNHQIHPSIKLCP
jgi:hypothetical protein